MIVFRYLPHKNKRGAALAGVPLDDISLSLYLELPEHKQRTIQACPFYEATEEFEGLEDVDQIDGRAVSETVAIADPGHDRDEEE